jgi:F-type H+-transporting ATPase subunit epsilon
VVLAQIAELSSDIDIKRAEEAKMRAEKFLASKSSDVDFGRAQLALLRAISRLNAVKHHTGKR